MSLPHATYALGIDAQGVVRMAPPIARWAIGMNERTVAARLRGRPGLLLDRI